MLIKILKHKTQTCWYKEHIGEFFEVEFLYATSSSIREDELFVIHETEFGVYGDKKYIYIHDTNYFRVLRKEKLEKINSI